MPAARATPRVACLTNPRLLHPPRCLRRASAFVFRFCLSPLLFAFASVFSGGRSHAARAVSPRIAANVFRTRAPCRARGCAGSRSFSFAERASRIGPPRAARLPASRAWLTTSLPVNLCAEAIRAHFVDRASAASKMLHISFAAHATTRATTHPPSTSAERTTPSCIPALRVNVS